jgi:hypothetical protein
MALTKVSYSMIQDPTGADPSGVTNNAALIQSVLNDSAGGTIQITPGVYRCNSGLTVPSNTTIIGYGATLDFSSAGAITALTFGSNVKFEGIKVVGAYSGSYNVNSIGILCQGTNNSPAAPTYVIGPTLQNVEITAFGNQAIRMQYVNKATISQCRITSCGYAGVVALSSNRVNIENSYIGQISPGSSGNAYGVTITRGSGTVTVDPISVFGKVIGNTVEDITVWTAIDTHAGSDILIANNIVQNCKLGINVTDADISGTPALGPKNVVISGNEINGLATGHAILVNGALTGGATVDYAENVSVTGNTIFNGGVTATATDGAIRIRSSRNITISGNSLRRPNVNGIFAQVDNQSFNISGNIIVDPHDTTIAASCIRVGGNNNKGLISDNTFVYENASFDTFIADYSAYLAGSYTGIDIKIGTNSFVGGTSTKLVLSNFARTYTAGTTTPSVSNTDFLSISNSTPTTISNFINGVEGQVVTFYFGDSNTTINRANCSLSGGVDFTSTAQDTLTLRLFGSVWYETSRSINS